VYNFWSREFIDINLKFIKLSFLEKLKKTDKNECIGEICTEFQLSMSASFKFICVVNFVKNVVYADFSNSVYWSEKNQGALRIPLAISIKDTESAG
jgi:hypothetical protein